MTPVSIVAYLALFTFVGIVFLFVNLMIGRLLRPKEPNEEKQQVYECGEPTIGSSFVQFDLRFYVVALLFIIFDVEVAFFFPWATVFGKSTQLLDRRVAQVEVVDGKLALTPESAQQFRELGLPAEAPLAQVLSAESLAGDEFAATDALVRSEYKLAVTSFFDILVFFGVLMVGFAYVWKRGDLDWVRAVSGERAAERRREPPVVVLEEEPALTR